MAKLQIHNFVDRADDDLSAFHDRIADDYPVNFRTDYGIDMSRMPWSTYSTDDDGDRAIGIDKAFIKSQLKRLRREQGDFLDIVSFVVPEEHWRNGERGIWGWHLGNPLHGYEVIITKKRDEYEKTAEHEVYHCFDDIVWTYCGYTLEEVFGLEGDYDKYLVHGHDRRFEEYEWDRDDVEEVLRPHLEKALKIKRGEISSSAINDILIEARKRLLQLTKHEEFVTAKKKA